MSQQQLTPWLYRRWRFDFPVSLFPAVLSRLRGTPARVEEVVRRAGERDFTAPIDNRWSVQRHLAHLADLEQLFEERLDAYQAGQPAPGGRHAEPGDGGGRSRRPPRR